MLIHEVCQRCKLTRKAVEYYEEQGLIQPRIAENGYRQFSQADVERLTKIATLCGLGLTVAEIASVLAQESNALAAAYHRKALEQSHQAEQQVLLKELMAHQDWAAIEVKRNALAARHSILSRLLEAFPGPYGPCFSAHFAPFLQEPIRTPEQQEALDTIIGYLDSLNIAVPAELEPALQEMAPVSTAAQESQLQAALQDPTRWLRENADTLRRYQEATASEAYRQIPAYRLQQWMRQMQAETGYTTIFLPAMRRLSPAYRDYCTRLEAANRTFAEALGQPIA